MSKTNEKFKKLSLFLCFILVFDFLVLNFGIKPKETKAAAIDISAARVINYDLKIDNNQLMFDFLKYLGENDTIAEATLKRGNNEAEKIYVSTNKKACKVKTVLIHGEKYELRIKANIDGVNRQLLYNFVYDDQDFRFKPILGFNDNRLELDLRKEFIDKFRDETKIVIDVVAGVNNRVVDTITTTVNAVKGSKYKVNWQNVNNLFNDNSAYLLKVSMDNEPYKSKFYVVTESGKKVCKNLFPVLLDGSMGSDGYCNLKIYIDVGLAQGDIVSINSSPKVQGNITDIAKKHVDFTEVRLNMDNDYDIRLERKGKETREAKFSFCALDKIEKLNCGIEISGENNNIIDMSFKDMEGFFSITDANNKLAIYELNDNFVKGEKIGEINTISGISKKCRVNLINGKTLKNSKMYLIELTNSERKFTISSPFIYSPTEIGASEIKETSVKISWSKPSGYTPVSGDKVEIFLRDKQSNDGYSVIPNVMLVHGTGNGAVDLSTTTSTLLKGIAPGTNYEAKVVIYNQRGSATNYVNFTTKPFVLTKPIEVKDAIYSDDPYKVAFIRSRAVTVQWDFDPTDIEFNQGDKVEIFVKLNGTTQFSGYPNDSKYGNPVFSATQNLNNIKSAQIVVPGWMDKFHVDLFYTIGGKKILTSSKDGYAELAFNRRTVWAKVNPPRLSVEDITQTSAKVKWEYDAGSNSPQPYQPENGQRVLINLKKVNSANDNTVEGFEESNEQLLVVQGHDNGDLLSTTECELTGLEVGQYYRTRVRHILQDDSFDGRWRFLDAFCNFKTADFSILGLKGEQQTTEGDSRKVKLTWSTSGTPDFGNNGSEATNVKIYLKEGRTSEYPEEPLSGINISHSGDFRSCIIDLPKYNIQYNVKLEYTLGVKKVEAYAMVAAVGEIGVELSNITDSTVTVKCILPNGYQKKQTDRVKLTITKQGEVSRTLPNDKELTINGNSATDTINSGLTTNGVYNVIVSFINDGLNVNTKTTSFKATSNLQLMGLTASNVKSKTATINWDYSPLSKEIKNNSKVEIFIKENPSKKASDDLSTYKKIYTFTQNAATVREGDVSHSVEVLSDDQHSEHQSQEGDMKKFKSLDLTKLRVNKEYSVKIKYTLDADGQRSSDETAEAEVLFKTIADTFKATVFTSNQTTASYGWEYPPGYDIQEGDKVEIFIKDVTDDSSKTQKQDIWTGVEAALTLTHEGETNLNDITAVDVSGLTPERKYKSKIEFTMGTGSDATTISTEVDISTKSFSIKSFEVDSYQEYDILVKWEIEPENMMFSPADKLEIFVKVAEDEGEKTDGELTQKPSGYPEQPSYKLTMDPDSEGKTVANTFSDYVLAESLGVKQKMLLVYTVGDKKYYKELEFINTINPVKAEVTSVDETRALISVTAPDNYEFVTGDRLLIYAKDEFVEDAQIESEDFLVFEGVQTETLSIPDDMKMIELSYLLPEAKYEVLVALDLEDGTVEPAKLEFTTTALPVSDIKLESLKHNSAVISWNYGENEIDFFKDENSYDFTDKLIIVHKEADGTPIPDDITAIKKLSHIEYLGEDIRGVKDADIKVEDPSKDYDVAVCYDLGGLLYKKNFKASYLSVKIDEESLTDKGVKINWKYPSNITFGDGDKTEVFVRKKDDANYPEAATFSSTGSGTVSYTFENLEGGTAYVAKVQITKEGLQIDPVEVEFETKSGLAEETVIEEIQEEIVGTEAQVTIPGLENLEVKEEELQVSMGDEAYKDFTVRLTEDGTGVIIEPTIPKKVYKNIEVTIPLEDGTVRKIVIAEFATQPENVGQDWLSNAYKFALDRFPDEGGYKYWYEERIQKKTMSGEYFLMNLLFGEDEFTNRNLGDKDLIAALYQIVVNREYDEEGLNFWIGIYNENLGNAQGNKKLAQEVLVDRMVHEAEFGKLCEKIGIFWTKAQQEAAGVPM